ncbi:MAG: DUF1549 domain-containing protein, partial [Planctomycetota bacterium]|nr:DUF1549 domain-containing protein [Planctomycetota bacterium]
MIRTLMPLLLVALLTLATENLSPAADPEAVTAGPVIEFNRDIRPILSNKCIACHGPDQKQRKAKLRLDTEASAKESVIVPGDVNGSELVARITSTDKELQMPPPGSGKTLNEAEISLIKRWIQGGAQYEPHWAYVAPRKHPAPQVTNTNWSTHWIDRFVLARIEAAGEQPAEDADRITLLRRVYFDLVGLPPTPAEVEAFLGDKSTKALATVVDRLLSSERFGERMAMYWLDLIRFADTV